MSDEIKYLQTLPSATEVKNSTKAMEESQLQRSLAISHPRNEEKVYQAAIKELSIVPGYAAKCFYSIPYKNDKGGITYVEGPSIKAAMALARRWGNCVNGARILDEDADRIVVEGVFYDYETNSRTLRTISVPKTYWSKFDKTMVTLRSDRLNLAIQAGLSKAVRNAILSSLPVWLVEVYYTKAKEIAATGGKKKAPTEKEIFQEIQTLTKDFIALGAEEKSVNEYIANLGKTMKPEEVLTKLIGLHNAFVDEVANVQDVFGKKEESKNVEGVVPNAKDLFDKPKK